MRKLSDDSIFPVKSPSQESILSACNDHFYIFDLSGKCQSVFSFDVPFLSESVRLHFIKPLLEAHFFKSHLKYLEREVKQESSIQRSSQLDINIRDSKAEFVAR